MSRLIDADKLCEYARNQVSRSVDANDIMRFPTVDAEPVRHGRWIRYPDCGVTVCSECRWSIEEAINYKYCPDCGADMREIE